MENFGNCSRKIFASGYILLQVTNDNLQILKKLESYFCQKIKIGDYFVLGDDYEQYIFSKNLKLQSRYKNHDGIFEINEDKTKIFTTYSDKKKLKFIEIISNIQCEIFSSYFIDRQSQSLKIGDVLVWSNIGGDVELFSKEDFTLQFTVVD